MLNEIIKSVENKLILDIIVFVENFDNEIFVSTIFTKNFDSTNKYNKNFDNIYLTNKENRENFDIKIFSSELNSKVLTKIYNEKFFANTKKENDNNLFIVKSLIYLYII